MAIDIQRGKLVGQQGAGSLYIDIDGTSFLISSPDKWYSREFINKKIDVRPFEIHDDRLEQQLGVTHFMEVPDYKKPSPGVENGGLQIPINRFPLVEYCSECGTINEAKALDKNKKHHCKFCNEKRVFIQFPIIVVCGKGHLMDFPYYYYAHTKKKHEGDYGRIYIERKGPSILNWTLKCTCGAEHSLTGVTGKVSESGTSPFQKEMNGGAHCFGNKPWTGDKSNEICDQPPVAVLKNGINVYRPELVEALSIVTSSQPGVRLTFDDVREQEYLRLNLEIQDQKDEQLKVTNSFVNDNNKIIKSVNYVNRLQELIIQTNFHRLTPSDEISSFDNASESFEKSMMFSQNVEGKWYPAKKVYGEGIFIEFNQEILDEWNDTENVIERFEKLNTRINSFYLKSAFEKPSIIAIHTLSHALIRQLSKRSGYPVTAIKEKIYNGKNFSGLLLYVTDSDKAGTYGGLVRLAKKHSFQSLFYSSLKDLEWCSSDPVCYEFGDTSGQGLSNSNGSACHNCSYVPDTACSYRNCFLDRDFISRSGSHVRLDNIHSFL